jgi:hemoglobin
MQTHYERSGGDAVIRTLVDRFYDLMDEDPDYYAIRKLHPADLAESRDKLYWFLSGWLGGPPLYTDRVGQPFLRRRHLPFSIGVVERDQWMACMTRAMHDAGLDAAIRDELVAAFFKTADFMRNRPE